MFLENNNLAPSKCVMDYSNLIVSNQKEESISIQRFNTVLSLAFGVCDQVRRKLDYSASETSHDIEIWQVVSLVNTLTRE